MQLTMEPLEEMLESARVMDEAGMDTIWLAEAYPWWRKHGMEARSSTVVSALMARETKRLTIGWGIISPFTRHPVQVAMDARVVQEAAGPGRFLLGFGTSKIFLNNIKAQTSKTLGPMRDAVAIVRGVLGGDAFEYDGDTWSASVPALREEAHSPREVPPVYVAATAPKMQALSGEIADGCLTPSITTPAFVRYTRENVAADIDIGCTVVASIDDSDRDAGRDGAREIAGMYLANKVQNIQGSADTLLDLADLTQEEIRPVADAMEQGGRLAAKAKVTDEILDKCKPIAGTPSDCIEAIEEYRDAGCTHVMLELWGEQPARADPPLRREGSPALPMIDERRPGRARDWASSVSHAVASRAPSRRLAEVVRGRLRGAGLAGAVAAGRGRAGERARHLRRSRRRAELMFNGHMDTSYSGREPWLAARPGLPAGGLRRGRAALRARDLEHEGRARLLRRGGAALLDDGVRLRGDVLVAAVRGEIEKTQQGRGPGRRVPGLRGRLAAPGRRTEAWPTCAFSASRPRTKLVLGHFGSLWLRISTQGPFVHTAFSEGRRGQNSIVRMQPVLDAVLEWIPSWEDELAYGTRCAGDRERGRRSRAASAGAPRARRTGPISSSTCGCRRRRAMADGAKRGARVCATRSRFPEYGVEAEIYVTAPGAEIARGSSARRRAR